MKEATSDEGKKAQGDSKKRKKPPSGVEDLRRQRLGCSWESWETEQQGFVREEETAQVASNGGVIAKIRGCPCPVEEL